MSMEGPPSEPEKIEKELITNEQCIEAMKNGNFEVVRAWYEEQEKEAEADPTIAGHLNLTVRFARLQKEAGFREDALETLEAAYDDAYNQGDDVSAQKIRSTIDQLAKNTF